MAATSRAFRRPVQYDFIARLLHWSMASALIVMLLVGGGWMSHGAGFFPTLHAAAGFTLLFLAFVRIVWRLIHPPPIAIHTISLLDQILATIVQGLMYFALVSIPLTGWLAFTEHVKRSMGVRPASFFWMGRIPLLPDYGIDFHFAHRWLGRGLMLLIAIHVLAVLKHRFIDKTDVLKRML